MDIELAFSIKRFSPQSVIVMLAVGTAMRTYSGWKSIISFECMVLIWPSMGGKHSRRFFMSLVSFTIASRCVKPPVSSILSGS